MDLRGKGPEPAKGPTGRNLDASSQRPLNWNLTCEDSRATLGEDGLTVNGRGGLQVPEDFSGRVAIKFHGQNCSAPAAKRGRDIILAFELSDAMAAADPVSEDGSCARSRMLREWAAHNEAFGFDDSDGEVRFSLILYSRIVLAKVAGFYPKVETVVQRLLSTQKKADLDGLLCLGRGAAELEPMSTQVEIMKSNFGRGDATRELVIIGSALEESAEIPSVLANLKDQSWQVSGAVFSPEQETLPNWTSQMTDELGGSLWSVVNESNLQNSLQSMVKNRIQWRFAHRLMTRPASDWQMIELNRTESDDGWQVKPIMLLDDGASWGIEAQLRAMDRFGVSNGVFGAYLQW